jgi:hypothetical protein
MKAEELYQCPYERACKCDLKDCCLECETFGEYLNGNTIPPQSMLTEMPSESEITKAIENYIAEGGDYFPDELAKCVVTYLKQSESKQEEIPSNKEIDDAVPNPHKKTEGGWNVMRNHLRKQGMDICYLKQSESKQEIEKMKYDADLYRQLAFNLNGYDQKRVREKLLDKEMELRKEIGRLTNKD